ncbi:MAG: tRNA (adenosine(37)-N6)-threonylcarbamoyltransferase complex dimerization subunit type 1 TsaB [Clostridia bacterium]|nr:tRNA (adenosine(37)-N6)-threonylcarbamoyltransferase complex dimerization subunit type 1 TsaB [Clostridia bacterium]
MRRLLAIDTSGPSLSVALLSDGALIYECVQQNGRTHSENLMAFVDAALAAGMLAPADVDCYACVTGPGSFTGVRIGVTTVRAISQATGKPCIGVNALEALAMNAAMFDGVVCALQDARAGQVYAAAFRRGGRVLPDRAMPIADFLRDVDGRCCFAGDGAIRHRRTIADTLGPRAYFPPEPLMTLRASSAAMIAYAHPDRAGGYAQLFPHYLRAPQAERERIARETADG